MGELFTAQLENLAPQHELGLTKLFLALCKNGDDKFFYPHPLTKEEARRLCRYVGLDQYLVATVNGRILGYGMLRGWDEGYKIPSLGLATHPEVRGQGLGNFLMSSLIQKACSYKASKLRLTLDARRGRFIKFCARHGFHFSPIGANRLLGMLDLLKLR